MQKCVVPPVFIGSCYMMYIENINRLVYNIKHHLYVQNCSLILEAGEVMRTSELIKSLCKEKKISQAELARRMGQTPQNFNKKLQRETITTEELMRIGTELGVIFEQSYTLETGVKLSISNESKQ